MILQLITDNDLTIAVSVGICIIALIQVLVIYLIVKMLKPRAELPKIEARLCKLSAEAREMEEKIRAFDVRLLTLAKIQDDMKESQLDFTYSQAEKLIAQGLDSSAVAANSGLSASEIDLMRLMHQESIKSRVHTT